MNAHADRGARLAAPLVVASATLLGLVGCAGVLVATESEAALLLALASWWLLGLACVTLAARASARAARRAVWRSLLFSAAWFALTLPWLTLTYDGGLHEALAIVAAIAAGVVVSLATTVVLLRRAGR